MNSDPSSSKTLVARVYSDSVDFMQQHQKNNAFSNDNMATVHLNIVLRPQ